MADKPFPLSPRSVIGVDEQGRKIKADADFIRLWNAAFVRGGEYEALTNVELEGLTDGISAAVVAAQADADAAQDDADTANAGVAAADARIDDVEVAVDLLELSVVTKAKGRFIYG